MLELLLRLLAQGLSPEDILRDYPHLTREDISAALLYVAKIAGEEDVYPLIV
jgi:uncharacterized protein (DUF433 family)